MTTATPARPTALVGHRAEFWQLARIHANRYLRHPVYVVGVALLVCGLLLTFLNPNDPTVTWDTLLTFEVFLGLGGVVVGRALAVTEDEAAALLPSTPVDRRTRTLALFAGCLVPAATAAVLMAASGIVHLLAPPDPGAYVALRPATGAIDSVDYAAWLLVKGPVAAFGGAALGVVVGRRVRFAGAGIAAAMLLFMVELVSLGAGSVVPGPGETWWARIPANLMPYAYWQADPDNLEAGALAMRPGSPTGHLLYALALCGLAVVAGVIHRATPVVRVAWLRIGSLFAGIAVVGYLWALLG